MLNWLKDKVTSLRVGVPVKTVNGGKPIDEVVIRYKEFYFMIDIDVESGEPTGDFGWSTQPMTPTPIRDFWTAQPPKTLLEESEEV